MESGLQLDQIVMPNIRVHKQFGSTYYLFIDDKRKELPGWATSKIALKRYLKRNFDIDLRTDPSIIKNYVEYEVRKLKNNIYIKRVLKR